MSVLSNTQDLDINRGDPQSRYRSVGILLLSLRFAVWYEGFEWFFIE